MSTESEATQMESASKRQKVEKTETERNPKPRKHEYGPLTPRRTIVVDGSSVSLTPLPFVLADLGVRSSVDPQTNRRFSQHWDAINRDDQNQPTPQGNTDFFAEHFGERWPPIQAELFRRGEFKRVCLQIVRGQKSVESALPYMAIAQKTNEHLSSPADAQEIKIQFTAATTCPLSGQPIKIATRFSCCRHSSCFDLESYLRFLREHVIEIGSKPTAVRPPPTPAASLPRVPYASVVCPVCNKKQTNKFNLVRDLEYERLCQSAPSASKAVAPLDIIVLD